MISLVDPARGIGRLSVLHPLGNVCGVCRRIASAVY